MNELKKTVGTKRKSKTINKKSSKKLNDPIAHSSTSQSIEENNMDSTVNNTNDIEKEPSSNNCINCAKCMCKSWRNQLQQGHIDIFEAILYGMKMAVMKTAPVINLQNEIELYPGTNIKAVKQEVLMAIAQANEKPRAMTRKLLDLIMTKEEMLKHGTGERLVKAQPKVFLAISGYLKENENITITEKEFINILNKRFWNWRTIDKLTPEQRQKHLANKAEQARINRAKRRSTAESTKKQMSKKMKT